MREDIQEIVTLGERICDRIDMIIEMDRRMSHEVMTSLEIVNWEFMRQTNELRGINKMIGV